MQAEGTHLDRIAFPMGGIGAGMICLEGTGALSHVSVRNKPAIFNEPLMFSALCVKGRHNMSRVLEGPVPGWKVFFPWGSWHEGAGNGSRDKNYGLPHFKKATFTSRFPFAAVELQDPVLPLEVELTGWSPFIPGDADNSSLPVAELEYAFRNRTDKPVEAVYSFHARNFMAIGKGGDSVSGTANGFVLRQSGSDDKPWNEGDFSATVDATTPAKVNCAWFRGGWFDSFTMVWKAIAEGAMPEAAELQDGAPSPGGSLYVPLSIGPREETTVRLRLGWYVPATDIRIGPDPDGVESGAAGSTHVPWYAARFKSIEDVNEYWLKNHDALRKQSATFSDCFHDTTLPPEVVESIAANLTILKSPTVLRQTDGRLWAWEGCCDSDGCCHGSCTHVWNYAQALPHLFPELERTLRRTEFGENQDERGHQNFRANLPIRPTTHDYHAASDGQLGGIMKVYRDWRISGDNKWLEDLWPRIRKSLEYCINTWDPDHNGVLSEPHHNTYDIEFWGPDGMCTSFYLGALRAAAVMAEAVGGNASPYEELLARGKAYMEDKLFNGEFFIQRIEWKNLRSRPGIDGYSEEAPAVFENEGPKYQYGEGCLADGVLGVWLAEMCGLEPFLDEDRTASHVLSVFRNNFKSDLSEHANPQRPAYALGSEAGLLACSWPKGNALSLPFPYASEVWTGMEYHVASHLAMTGHIEEALEIVRAVRSRYDGRIRNPFNEYECGHWYARAMSSYGLIQGLTGIRYDAVDKVLIMRPGMKGDFRAFLSTATGYGTAGIKDGKPFLEVKRGQVEVKSITYLSNGA
jgi:uncharacterized protein (DUF608 family)